MFHLGTFDNFKHYYLHFIRIYLKRDFPDAVSYNRFVELESRVFFKMRAQGDCPPVHIALLLIVRNLIFHSVPTGINDYLGLFP